ncbi:HNH endonuclease signature motif containing protein [Mycobacterium simiae]|uniref:HNH endonuclease signature motif containing protein n=1 Tax=Mycobacterium simiae TaxID=1784 RepID=UPI00263789F5|nr:HNH endonuclease signature motif containing protein [Mycobacterium simiae]
MTLASREQIQQDYDALRAAVSRIQQHSYESMTNPELLGLLEAIERETRKLHVPGHRMINQLARQATSDELGGKLTHALSDRLSISRAESARRVAEADDLGPRQALTGEPLEPRLAATAAAQREGAIGTGQIAVIRQFFAALPSWVDVETQAIAERQLAQRGTEFRPEQLRKLADRLACCLNPDGIFTDADRARRRGLTLGKQDIDGMSRLCGWITPEARATLEAVLAKLAAPGMCNPEDLAPIVDGAPGEEAIRRDSRSTSQRNHDGLNAALRAVLASGELGQHNGLLATIIVSTTLRELESASGKALTAGGTLLPMSDVIRMARHAHHYLTIFDDGRAIGLYHTKRLASPGQRIVLHAKDRGCSAPGCEVPGYLCEVHHVDDYAVCRTTGMDNLTFACGSHHRLIKPGGWTTRKRSNGDIEWIPPPHQERGQPRTNTFHHPETLLCDDGP